MVKEFDEHSRSGAFSVYGNVKYGDVVIGGNIFIKVDGGKVIECVTEKTRYKRFGILDEYMNVDEPRYRHNAAQLLDLEKSLLDANRIHELKNTVHIKDRINGLKCYIASSITALYNSPRFRQDVEMLCKSKRTKREIYGVKDWQISVAIKKLFDIIERKREKDETDEAMADLIDRMERMELIDQIEADGYFENSPNFVDVKKQHENSTIGKSEYRG